MSDNTIINKLNAELKNKIAEIRNTYNTDPKFATLETEIKNLRNQIEAISAWSKVS